MSFEEELEHLSSQLVDDETSKRKKVYDQRLLELKEKRNLFDKMKTSFEQEAEQRHSNNVVLEGHHSSLRSSLLRLPSGCSSQKRWWQVLC